MTEMQLEQIRQLNAAGKFDTEIAALIGVTSATICRYRQKMGIPSNRAKPKYRIPLDQIREMNQAGMNDAAIADELGVPYWHVNHNRQEMGLPIVWKHRYSREKKAKYAAYNRYTSEFICEGTAKEVAEFLGLKQSTIYPVACRTKKGCPDGRYEIIRVEQDDDE